MVVAGFGREHGVVAALLLLEFELVEVLDVAVEAESGEKYFFLTEGMLRISLASYSVISSCLGTGLAKPRLTQARAET